jgi:uncharacterized Tic20 family protein
MAGEKPTNKDDNLMAALAHVGIIVGGILIALIIWVTQKDKSKYVDFQAKQALAYQLAVGVVFFVMWIVAIALTVLMIGFLLIPVALLFMLLAVIYGLYGAYKCYQGENFRYAIIGDWLAK